MTPRMWKPPVPPDDEAQTLHAFLASHGNVASPANLRNVLSTSSKSAADKPRQANTHLAYTVGKHRADKPSALIDRGANGGVAGADIGVHRDDAPCSLTFKESVTTKSTDLKIVTAGGVVLMQHGPVITIFHQYAHLRTGKTIHLSVQL